MLHLFYISLAIYCIFLHDNDNLFFFPFTVRYLYHMSIYFHIIFFFSYLSLSSFTHNFQFWRPNPSSSSWISMFSSSFSPPSPPTPIPSTLHNLPSILACNASKHTAKSLFIYLLIKNNILPKHALCIHNSIVSLHNFMMVSYQSNLHFLWVLNPRWMPPLGMHLCSLSILLRSACPITKESSF